MTDSPDWTTPDEGERPPGPPQRPQQPPPGGWGAPPPQGWGQQPQGWGQQPGPGQPPPGWGQPQGPPPPGWGQPPGPPPPGWGQQPGPGQPPPGWGGQQQWGQQQWGRPPWAEVKPGVIPLRPLGVGEILDGSITTMRSYPKATIGLSAIVVGLTTVVTMLTQASFLEQIEDQSESLTPEFPTAGLGAFVAGVLLAYLATTVLTGTLTVVIGQAVLGRPISLGGTWERVRPRILALIGTSMLAGLILAGPFLLLVLLFVFVWTPPAVLVILTFILYVIYLCFFWPMLALATAALMLEGQSVTRAIRRSMHLVKPDYWRCFGILLLGVILVWFVGSALSIPFTFAAGAGGFFDATAADDLGLRYYVVTGIGSVIGGAVTTPIASGMSALLYVDRRMRLEGLDVTLAAAATSG